MTRPPLTQSELAELRQKAEAATLGPWTAVANRVRDNSPDGVAHVMDKQAPMQQSNNCAFIAAANPATVLALLDMVAAQAEDNDWVYLRVQRPEDYKDVHPQLLMEDFLAGPDHGWTVELLSKEASDD